MKPRFRVTYEIVTFESAEHGDAAERGFVDAGGGQWPIAECKGYYNFGMTLREALNLCWPREDCGNWFTETDADINYTTGEHTTRSLHPPCNISAASYERLRKLLRIK